MNALSNAKLQFFNIGKYGGMYTDFADFSKSPRPFFSIGMILKGNGNFYVENSDTVSVSHGDIIIVPSAATYVSDWSGKPDIAYITFHFIFQSGFDGNIEIQRLSGFERLEDDFKFAYDNFTRSAQPFKVMSIFYNVLHKVYPKIKISSEKRISASIKKAVDYITVNYAGSITLPELCKIANLSQSRFFTLFKRETGMTPIEYKNRICVKNAEKLIASGDLSIEEISERLGFNSSSYFRRTFRAYTGKSPREYKNSFKNDLRL